MGISRDSRDKRLATGGKRKTCIKKRKCIFGPFAFLQFCYFVVEFAVLNEYGIRVGVQVDGSSAN
ncbi:hypothetical protein MtrunA17_Chr8g0339131 [Medicago truncatula]|uniref:Transmembrane protein n=1 Tax=Medicago truncatula TaxID=3880 RepID=A0A396GBI9_MEDTR|nr:hypothetical protein MtrunA17_Chr8g0339131 [Medicago truncatula]